MSKRIVLGGPSVYNAGQHANSLWVGRVEGIGSQVSAVFDVDAPGYDTPGGGYVKGRSVCSNISEAQASELIDALEEVFPDLVEEPEVKYVEYSTPADLALRAAARPLVEHFRNWESIPRGEIKAFIDAVTALNDEEPK